MLILILGLILFLGIHSVRVFAPELRERQIAAGGEARWKGTYSVIALLGLVLIVWGYGRAWPTSPVLYQPPVAMRHLATLLMLFAFVALASSFFPAGRIKAALKHPMLVSVKIWAFAHLLANGELIALILFGLFLAWGVMLRIALKRRGAPVPVAGPARWDAAAVGAGLALYLLFLWRLHLWLFGAAPLG